MSDKGSEEDRQGTRNADQPWGTETHGEVGDRAGGQGGKGVGGASLAGTPAGSGRGDAKADEGGASSTQARGVENAEAETSGLEPPEGTPSSHQGHGEPPKGPGAFADDVTPPPVYDV